MSEPHCNICGGHHGFCSDCLKILQRRVEALEQASVPALKPETRCCFECLSFYQSNAPGSSERFVCPQCTMIGSVPVISGVPVADAKRDSMSTEELAQRLRGIWAKDDGGWFAVAHEVQRMVREAG